MNVLANRRANRKSAGLRVLNNTARSKTKFPSPAHFQRPTHLTHTHARARARTLTPTTPGSARTGIQDPCGCVEGESSFRGFYRLVLALWCRLVSEVRASALAAPVEPVCMIRSAVRQRIVVVVLPSRLRDKRERRLFCCYRSLLLLRCRGCVHLLRFRFER